MLAPHFAMELHVHLAAAYPREPWVEHFEWLEPLFNERLEIKDGRMLVPTRPGLGVTLSEQSKDLDPRRSGDWQAPVTRDRELRGVADGSYSVPTRVKKLQCARSCDKKAN